MLGYLAVRDGEFMKQAERYRLVALTLGASLAAWWVLSGHDLRDSLSAGLPRLALLFLASLASWLVIVGLLGCGRRYLDRPSPALAYLARASYPIYILHQTVIVVLAFYLVGLPAPEPLQWVVLFVGAVASTFVLYELVRRFAVTRVLFGMKAPKKRPAVGSLSAALPSATHPSVPLGAGASPALQSPSEA